ncbi:MAG: hypothetical protein JXA33_00155 [Anaerolineae bacterium]|nr:hypothetical protein [Anaerolineae bacterium]
MHRAAGEVNVLAHTGRGKVTEIGVGLVLGGAGQQLAQQAAVQELGERAGGDFFVPIASPTSAFSGDRALAVRHSLALLRPDGFAEATFQVNQVVRPLGQQREQARVVLLDDNDLRQPHRLDGVAQVPAVLRQPPQEQKHVEGAINAAGVGFQSHIVRVGSASNQKAGSLGPVKE